MNNELIERTKQYLFASRKEMEQAKLPIHVQARLIRLRDVYTYWLERPQTAEGDIVTLLNQRYEVSRTVAYEDLRLLRICVGSLSQASRDYYRWRFLQYAEEAFQMARDKKDPRAFASVLSAYGKYTNLDKAEADAPAYSDIVPQTFVPTSDPSVIGLKPIPNWREKARRLEQKYIHETEVTEADFTEMTTDKE